MTNSGSVMAAVTGVGGREREGERESLCGDAQKRVIYTEPAGNSR